MLEKKEKEIEMFVKNWKFLKNQSGRLSPLIGLGTSK
jgi:hypothetical protein